MYEFIENRKLQKMLLRFLRYWWECVDKRFIKNLIKIIAFHRLSLLVFITGFNHRVVLASITYQMLRYTFKKRINLYSYVYNVLMFDDLIGHKSRNIFILLHISRSLYNHYKVCKRFYITCVIHIQLVSVV